MTVRRLIKKFDVFTAMLLIALLLTGCALGGTEAGNPSFNPTENKEPVYFTEDILRVTCTHLNQCYPSLSVSDCIVGVRAQANFAPALGLGMAYATFQDAINAEKAGTILADITHALTCTSQIAALACGSAPVLNAYSPGAAADFSNVVNLIPTSSTSCPGVF